ncbi:hypothetical protein Ciccas_012624 [Cichlidogyrus casuarinus]|uniref:Oxidation resistance protein 1 n=1 Tax=Cichlidogyrus casuarinus TaxID=1844966 RepID=A0ABD2PNC4_9PLAT
MQNLPAEAEGLNWSLTFSTTRDGFSLKNFYRHATAALDPDFDHSKRRSNSESVPTTTNPNAHSSNRPCLLLIKDEDQNIFGACLNTHPYIAPGRFYGNGACFVFRWKELSLLAEESHSSTEEFTQEELHHEEMHKDDADKLIHFEKFAWAQDSENCFFVNGEAESLTVGCSDEALRLDEQLLHGTTGQCATFNSPPLNPNTHFRISALELWTFL